ncbi:MAG TPA: arsenite methyltransferase [Candidatus Deferrimicrobiaceae bacterium]
MNAREIRKSVRERYAGIAKGGPSCCGPSPACAGESLAEKVSRQVGYSEKETGSVPEGANLGLGCGNPTALASIRPGETVLDLGSGAGFDCFLAAKEVGPRGRVIGVDMTAEMIEKARENARRGGYENVEFRLGEIENLPVPDASVDLVLSNCVINLSTNKRRVFEEAFRVLRPGGRLMISDLVLEKHLPESIRESVSAYVGCVAGALPKEEYLEAIRSAGFRDVGIAGESAFPVSCFATDPLVQRVIEEASLPPGAIGELEGSVASIKVYGRKP